MTTTTENKITELQFKCRAFVGEEPKLHNMTVDARGMVRVFDPVSNRFTYRHNISEVNLRAIRKEAGL